MYRNSPKLMLRIDLKGDKEVDVILVLLDKYYTNHHKGSNSFYSKDGFIIYRGNIFTVFKSGCLHLPTNFINGNRQSVKLVFDSDENRHKFLKNFKNTLLEWSKSVFWFGFSEEEKIKLTYTGKVWILF